MERFSMKSLLIALAVLAAWPVAANAKVNDVPPPPSFWMHEAPCPSYTEPVACASYTHEMPPYRDGDPAIWVPKGWGPEVYHHERGHVFDNEVMDDSHRAKFLALTDDPREWWGEDPCIDPDAERCELNPHYDPPGERFADAYAFCALRGTANPARRDYRWRLWAGASDIIYNRQLEPVRPVGVESAYGYKAPWRRHLRVCQMISRVERSS
jgi:hypothetical protein